MCNRPDSRGFNKPAIHLRVTDQTAVDSTDYPAVGSADYTAVGSTDYTAVGLTDYTAMSSTDQILRVQQTRQANVQ